MGRLWIFHSMLFVCLALSPAIASAQTDEPTEAEKAKQAEASAAKQQAQSQKEQSDKQKSQLSLHDYLDDPNKWRRASSGGTGSLDAQLFEFRRAIPKFRAATVELRQTIGLELKLDKALKNIQTQANVLIRYFNSVKIKHPQPDAADFKDYSQSELQWATLNSAETIGAYLDLAVAAERKDVVEAKTLAFLYQLDGELLRLKWLTSHTKD